MSRRISALLLSLVLVLSLAMCVSAAESNASLAVVAQRHGQRAVVTVSLTGGQGISNGRVAVSYDPETLTLTDAQTLAQCGGASINQETAGIVYLAWVGSNLESEAAILRLTFQVKTGGDLSFAAEVTEAYAGQNKVEVAASGVTLPGNPFVDIDDHWAREEILNAHHEGLFIGVTPTTFVPEGSMTRAMFVTALYRMAGEPEVTTKSGFTDVDSRQYYAAAVEWAAEAGVTNGMGNGKFMPGKAIDRQEMATMLYRYAGAEGRYVQETKELADFVDATSVSDWAVEAVRWVVAEGILKGYPGNYLMPGVNATRAQAATILCRYLGY